MTGPIVAIGGGTFLTDDPDPRLDAFILGLTGRQRPNVCYLGTAKGDAHVDLYRFYKAMSCWFEGSTTDSFGPTLGPLADGLGFLPGSACPHYDSDEQRRPLYRRLVDTGALGSGWAADDYAALHFAGGAFVEAVALREGARGYRVEPGAETALPTRILE